jgi:hypothetical protein
VGIFLVFTKLNILNGSLGHQKRTNPFFFAALFYAVGIVF